MGDQSVSRPLRTYSIAQTQTCMPKAGFEPTIPALEQVKFYALDRAATVISHEDVWGNGRVAPRFFTTVLNGVER
jgi:hypothetical protein